jgi:hypothetical protein
MRTITNVSVATIHNTGIDHNNRLIIRLNMQIAEQMLECAPGLAQARIVTRDCIRGCLHNRQAIIS